jgi:hypothetical protein
MKQELDVSSVASGGEKNPTGQLCCVLTFCVSREANMFWCSKKRAKCKVLDNNEVRRTSERKR